MKNNKLSFFYKCRNVAWLLRIVIYSIEAAHVANTSYKGKHKLVHTLLQEVAKKCRRPYP